MGTSIVVRRACRGYIFRCHDRCENVPRRPGKQFLHLPGDRARGVSDQAEADRRPYVHRGRCGSADLVNQADRDKGMLLPRQDDIHETEITTAIRIAEYIFEQGQDDDGGAAGRYPRMDQGDDL
jgi:hypothetical protein